MSKRLLAFCSSGLALLFAALALVAATPASAALMWNEGPIQTVYTTNCITGQAETLSHSFVGWFADPLAPPQLNTVYYARVRWFVTGNPCIGGARVAPELFLPDGSTLAISAANPVKCFALNIQTGATTREFAACPQTPSVGARYGLGFLPIGQGAWPTAQGFGWEIHVPMISTARLNGVVTSTDPTVACPDCLTAAVWSIDGLTSPTAFPRVGVRTAGGATVPTITYPVPSVMNVTNTTADGTATLNRAGTTGSVFAEESLTPPSASTCNQSSGVQTITAQDPAILTFPLQFSQLSPGTNVYWRLCYITGGRTFWGATQVFRTTGIAPPRVFSLSPDIALPGRQVVLTGADLAGATSLVINGTQGPVSALIVNVTPNTITFVVPSVHYLVGNVSVTTPGGTVHSTVGFQAGIDTILDSVTVAATNGGPLANDVVIRFHSSEPFPFPHFECHLDQEPIVTSCDSGVVFYDDLAPGPHSLKITARSGGWSDWPPLVVAFTVVNADTTPPATMLLSGPQGFINTATPVFTFSSEPGATFECRLNGPYSRWVPCTSPHTVTGLSQGSHGFEVRARDAALNVDPTPARTSFVVDTVPPDTILISYVPAPGDTTTTSRTASFAALMINGSRLECSLDGMPFIACRAPLTYTNLLPGMHTFNARAIDWAGNVDPSPATRTWQITP